MRSSARAASRPRSSRRARSTATGAWPSSSRSWPRSTSRWTIRPSSLRSRSRRPPPSPRAPSPHAYRRADTRAGKLDLPTFASGKPEELSLTPAPRLVGWAQDRIIWAAVDGFYTQADDGSGHQVAALPATGSITVLSIAPDGGHAIYRQGQNLFILDFAGGKSAQLGPPGAAFET